jgi:hypothetical protein
MDQPHVSKVTLSPKGQVATARCSCGWESKHRSQNGATPMDLADEAATLHAGAGKVLVSGATHSSGKEVAPGRPATPPTTGEHEYTISPAASGPVVATCRCGWSREYSGVGAEDRARQFAEAHANTVVDPDSGMPAAKSVHDCRYVDFGDEVETRCTCGWSERFSSPGRAVFAGKVHMDAAKPWDAGSVLATIGCLGIAALLVVLMGFAIASRFTGDSSDDSGTPSDYSDTYTGGGGDTEEDKCRKLKAWWADRENGEDVISGMGDCEDW